MESESFGRLYVGGKLTISLHLVENLFETAAAKKVMDTFRQEPDVEYARDIARIIAKGQMIDGPELEEWLSAHPPRSWTTA